MESVPPIFTTGFLKLRCPSCLAINSQEEGGELIVRISAKGVIRLGGQSCAWVNDVLETEERGSAVVKVDTASWSEAILGLPVVQVVVNNIYPEAKRMLGVRPSSILSDVG